MTERFLLNPEATYPPFRVLILGGTSEGCEIARRLAHRGDLSVISSLAGRVNEPKIPDGQVRIGGFGGVDGLISFLQTEKIDAVIDATHPFAARISANAESACTQRGVTLIAFFRAPWVRQEGDRWHSVSDVESAAAYVAETAGRVFLAIGRQQIEPFAACRKGSLLIRAITPPEVSLPANTQLILARGPFRVEDELQLLRNHAIDYIVSKNSGGHATYAKIEAARLLGIPVVMIERPLKYTTQVIDSVDGVLASLGRLQLRMHQSREICAS